MNEDDARIVAALERVLEGARVETVVTSLLRSLPDSNASKRALHARTLFEIGVMRRRVAHVHGVDARDAAALYAAWRAGEPREEDLPPWPSDPHARMELERSASRLLVDTLVAALGVPGADAFLAASNRPGPVSLRVALSRVTREAAAQRLAAEGIRTRPGMHAATCLHVEQDVGRRANLFGARAWRDGCFEVQDEGSQCVAASCAVAPGDVVVDYCAGRGGKTIALADAMQDRGTVHVHDTDSRALRDLRARIKRTRFSNVRFHLPARASADVVLADVPCSSLGPLRRSPDLRWHLDEHALRAFPTQQLQIARDALAFVKPGGRFVYATCTVRPEENEGVVRALLESHRELALVQETPWLPHVHGTDGFYVAVIRRTASC